MRVADAVLLIVAGTAGTGCASVGFHPVSFIAESSQETVSQAPRTAYVVRNTQMQDTILEARIRARLEAFLLSNGYVITSPDTAEIYVLASFGSGERAVPSIAAVFRPAEVKEEHNPDGQVIRRTRTPERMDYLRLPLMKNSVWLQVLSSDAKYFRETGKVRNFWRAESSTSGQRTSLEAYTPYLLVPALKYFGRETKDVMTIDVRAKDAAWE